MTLSWRAATVADSAALAQLYNAAIAADGTGGAVTSELVAEGFAAPRFNPATDTFTAWQDGELLAAGSLRSWSEPVDDTALISFDGDVHPDARGRGIGRALLERLLHRARELGASDHPGYPVRVRTAGGLAQSDIQRLLESAGFVPDNYFITMQVELAEAASTPPAECVPLAADLMEATRLAHNDAFRDHRNFSPLTAPLWQHWMASSTSRPNLGRVIVRAEEVVAYAIVGEYEPGVAHIELVGTRRSARGQGLARAVLHAVIAATRDAGFRVAELEVDSTSPTGADRLYTSVGFVGVRTISRYQRLLP